MELDRRDRFSFHVLRWFSSLGLAVSSFGVGVKMTLKHSYVSTMLWGYLWLG